MNKRSGKIIRLVISEKMYDSSIRLFKLYTRILIGKKRAENPHTIKEVNIRFLLQVLKIQPK